MTDSQGRLTAADVPELEFLRLADELSRCPTVTVSDEGTPYYWGTGHLPRWVGIMEIQYRMPDYPPKVVAAKFAKLVKRGIVSGCACGCRGDIELTDAGRAILAGVQV